jgi:hypothetical protein
VGLTLAESKELLQTIQQKMIGQQVTTHLRAHQPVGLRKNGSYPLQLKTLFGNVTVESPRYYLPPTAARPKTFSPPSTSFRSTSRRSGCTCKPSEPA